MADAASQVVSGLLRGDILLIDEVGRGLTPEHFVDPTLRSLFRSILTYRSIGGGVLTDAALESISSGVDAGTAALLRESFAALVSQAATADQVRWSAHQLRLEHEKRLTSAALRDASDILAGSITEEGPNGSRGRTWSGPSDAREWMAARVAEINAETQVFEAPAADVFGEGRTFIEDYIRARDEDKSRRPMSGIPAFDDLTGGLGRGLIIVGGSSGFGKAMPLDACVLTPNGFVTMGSLRVGDAVVDPRGMPSQVLGVYPQGERDVYRVTFSDGTSCEADGDHLWETSYWAGILKTEVIKTTELLRRRSTAVPYLEVAPDLGSGELPLDPYVLGVLVGDGYLKKGTPQLTCADAELVEHLRAALPVGVQVLAGRRDPRTRASTYLVRGVRGGHGCNPVSGALDVLGLRVGSADKFVPERYKRAPASVRLSVLQGLLDTDGSVVSGGGAAFDSVSRQLRDDVVWLARSLGFRVTDNGPEGDAHKYFNVQHQEWRESQPRYRSYISAQRPGLPVLFRLSRKAQRAVRDFSGKRVRNARRVASVEFVRRAPVQCIAVSAPSHLYVTDDFIVTHNTQFCVSLAYHASQMQGLNVFFATSETVRSTVRARLIARHSRHEKFAQDREDFGLPLGLDSQKIDRGTLRDDHVPFLARIAVDWGATGQSPDGSCYVAQMPHGQTMMGLQSQIETRARTVRPDLVIIDYLALMSSLKRHESTRAELSSIVKEAAHFSIDYNKGNGVPTVSPWQLNRESQKELVRTGVLETSGFAETAEVVNSAHLVAALTPDGARDGRLAGVKLNVLKHRDGQLLLGDSAIPLQVDYATSLFSSRAAAPGTGEGTDERLFGLLG